MVKHRNGITMLVASIMLLVTIATLTGLFLEGGSGERSFTTLFGEKVNLIGKGLYANHTMGQLMMVLPHDWILLLGGVPLLFLSLLWFRKGSLRGAFLLAGVVGYIFISYFMYVFIAVYNRLFLVYIGLISLSFFTLFLLFLSMNKEMLSSRFRLSFPRRWVAWSLLIISTMIGLLWLSITLPTLIQGSIPTQQMEQLTTLPVQAIDLAFFIPSAFVTGILLLRKRPFGTLFTPPFFIFLCLMMFTLFMKSLMMGLSGIKGTEPMMIMAFVLGVLAIISSYLIFQNLDEGKESPR